MIQIENYEYARFKNLWNAGVYKGQRLGQAFYNHFNLHKMNRPDDFNRLYERDGSAAVYCINQQFEFV